MTDQQHQEPETERLDRQPNLATKLWRWLRIWTLDCIRLFYWVFFYPQRLDRHVSAVAREESKQKADFFDLLKQVCVDPALRRLCVQGLVLTLVVTILATISLNVKFQTETSTFSSWWLGVAFFMALALIRGVPDGIKKAQDQNAAMGVASGVAMFVVWGVGIGLSVLVGRAVALALEIAPESTDRHSFGVAQGVATGIADAVTTSLVVGLMLRAELGGVLGPRGAVLLGAIVGLAVGVWVGLWDCFTVGVAWAAAHAGSLGVVCSILIPLVLLEPIDWTLSWLFRHYFGHVTLVRQIGLRKRLVNRLQADWKAGVEHINELLENSHQLLAASQAVNDALAKMNTDEERFIKVAELAEVITNWRVVLLAAGGTVHKDTPNARTPVQHMAAGFWWLFREEPENAVGAFEKLQGVPHSEEMIALSRILADCNSAEEVAAIGDIDIPLRPYGDLLRPVTWDAIDHFRRIVAEAKVFLNSASRTVRALALGRAVADLDAIEIDSLPNSEYDVIMAVCNTWANMLFHEAGEILHAAHPRQVIDPYVIANPVYGPHFVGRDAVMREFIALWNPGEPLKSVLLFGKPRIGKTSILLNMMQRLPAGIRLVYVNLPHTRARTLVLLLPISTKCYHPIAFVEGPIKRRDMDVTTGTQGSQVVVGGCRADC